jgi:hypothetical protein
MFYIDPKSARVVEAYGERSLLLLGGTSWCVTSVILAFQLLKRRLFPGRATFGDVEAPSH